jgi:hypothetical protein
VCRTGPCRAPRRNPSGHVGNDPKYPPGLVEHDDGLQARRERLRGSQRSVGAEAEVDPERTAELLRRAVQSGTLSSRRGRVCNQQCVEFIAST